MAREGKAVIADDARRIGVCNGVQQRINGLHTMHSLKSQQIAMRAVISVVAMSTVLSLVLGFGAARALAGTASTPPAAAISERLTAAYPGIVTSGDATAVTFADGTTLPLDDGRSDKSFNDWLTEPDIEDMFRYPYPAGAAITAPPDNFDPGRARNAAFFTKIYGDCRKGEVVKNLADIVWLPKKGGVRLKATRINGVAAKLQAVSDALDKLPAPVRRLSDATRRHLQLPRDCRHVVTLGAQLRHRHRYRHAARPLLALERRARRISYRNAIPPEIVAIFEQHGFIWGGRWHHYDTMHFEYRPELFARGPPGVPMDGAPERPAAPVATPDATPDATPGKPSSTPPP